MTEENLKEIFLKLIDNNEGVNVKLLAYPVGSYYWTSSPENPKDTLGGGIWEQIKGRYLYSCSDSDKSSANVSGGEFGSGGTYTLTAYCWHRTG